MSLHPPAQTTGYDNYAYVNSENPNVKREVSYGPAATERLPSIDLPFVTTAPILVEARYFLGKRGGWKLQDTLWQMLRLGKPEVVRLEDSDLDRS